MQSLRNSLNSLNENSKSSVMNDTICSTNEASELLTKLRTTNKERLILGHLNINHIQNKFEPLVSLLKDKLDLFLLTCSRFVIDLDSY